MGFSVDIRGLKEAERKLKRLEKNVRELGGEIPIEELLSRRFMTKHSRYGSFEELVRAGGFVESNEPLTADTFRAIPDDDWDKWILRATAFANWEEMQKAAADDYISRKVFEGI